MKIKQRYTQFFTLLFVSIIWFLIGWFTRNYLPGGPGVNLTAEQQLLLRAQEAMTTRYYPALESLTEFSPQAVTQAAIRGMLQITHDPYNAFFPPTVSGKFQADFTGETGVPGLWFDIVEGQLVLVKVPEGRPADLAGLQVGDIIKGVDGIVFNENTSGDEASLLMRGPANTTTRITIQRGGETLEIDVLREPWKIVSTQMIDGIGYLKLEAIPANAADKMKLGLEELLQQNMTGLIWDLRNSGGGSMQATEEILSYFMANAVIYSAEFKDGTHQEFTTGEAPILPDLPLVILIDEKTYSSSEMAALAIGEHKRGLLLGKTTKGKGMIQDTLALDEQNLLRISIAKWLSPSGQWIQGKGVGPDIEMVDDPATPTDELVAYAIDYIQQALTND